MISPGTIKAQFWVQTPEEALGTLETSRDGLSEPEAALRAKSFGKNALPRERRFRLLRMFFSQFKSPLIVILILAGTVTALLRDYKDSIAIFAAVILNALLGFYQEAKAESALSVLETYVREKARVIRDGREYEIDAADLVPGDVIRVAHGMKVPADGRIVLSVDLEIDESILTGESLPAEKSAEASPADAALADRLCMAYSGTTVVEGVADVVVTATGVSTELGKIASAVTSAGDDETPLQKSLSRFTLQVGVMVLVLTGALFAFGLSQGKTAFDMFLISVAVGVSAVPEGLPIALTVILAIGVERLAKKKGVVRRLLAAETLGGTTVVMTDKTGTLTEANMRLSGILPYDGFAENELLEYSVLLSGAVIENPDDEPALWRALGNPIESATVKAGALAGIFQKDLAKRFSVIDRQPFSSVNKYSALLAEHGGARTAIFFGAPEAVARLSSVSPGDHGALIERVDTLAHQGERVLGIAIVRNVAASANLDDVRDSKTATFAGLLTFRDPVRATVADAIARMTAAGVRTMIVTGDHPGTAKTIAREIGWDVTDADVLTGADVSALSDEHLLSRLKSARVIARVAPEQKLRIANLLRGAGEVVAMTGDGVNDAPALRAADIGIAVGTGTDVAKAAADLVMLDNNFEIIVSAIEEGRKILQNIRKVIAYLMSSVFDELVLIAGAIALGISLPLSAIQILWVNLMIGALPAVALAFESHHSDIGTKPLAISKRLLDGELRFLIFGVGTATSVMLLGMYALLLKFGFDGDTVRTFIFGSFGAYALFLVFSVRSLKTSVFSYPILSNRFLVAAVLVGFMAMGLAIYAPILQNVLGTVPLGLPWIGGIALFGFASILLVELGKWIFRAIKP